MNQTLNEVTETKRFTHTLLVSPSHGILKGLQYDITGGKWWPLWIDECQEIYRFSC